MDVFFDQRHFFSKIKICRSTSLFFLFRNKINLFMGLLINYLPYGSGKWRPGVPQKNKMILKTSHRRQTANKRSKFYAFNYLNFHILNILTYALRSNTIKKAWNTMLGTKISRKVANLPNIFKFIINKKY